jgi:asparagine synthase (glutamine-hydrolysing)
MCGIAGILRVDGQPVPVGLIDAMVATLRHRGPDGEGAWLAPEGSVGFGHTRLRIIDLTEASDQPIVDEAAQLSLIFNGEIYNYIELREELKDLGHQFKSEGDGEVILRAYEEWGVGCLPRLNGMFAFDLGWRKAAFRARPLRREACASRGALRRDFASERRRSLLIRLSCARPTTVLYRYRRGDLDLDEGTFFEGINSVPAAHYLLVDAEGNGKAKRYWRATSVPVPSSRKQAIEHFRELLFDSVRLRLRSDVPVGSSLSGGLDSSSIVATINAQKANNAYHQRTFSARFHSTAHDEGPIETLTGQVDADAHGVWVEPDSLPSEFAKLQWHQEEPIASASPYAQWCVMRLAHEQDTTVLLDGQGADELLAGYDQSHGMFWAHWARRGRIDRVLTEVVSYAARYHGVLAPIEFGAYYSLPASLRDGLAEQYYRSASLVSPELHREYRPAHVRSYEPFPDRLRNELVRWQTTTQLPEFLRYADRNSMAFSREVRLPFLDHRLVEYCFGLQPQMLLNRAVTKVVLREAMQGIVPADLNRKDKLAYAPRSTSGSRPLRPWIEDAQRREAEDIFNRNDAPLRERLRRDRRRARLASGRHRAWYQTRSTDFRDRPASEASGLNW